jgi:hypothetical protein
MGVSFRPGRWLTPWHVSLALNNTLLVPAVLEAEGWRAVLLATVLWLIAAAFGYLGWRLLFEGEAMRARTGAARVWVAASFLTFVLLAFLSIGVRAATGALPDESVIYFVGQNGRYAWAMVASRLDGLHVAALMVVLALAALSIRAAWRVATPARRGRLALVLPLLLLPPVFLDRGASGLEQHLVVLGARVLGGQARPAPVDALVNTREAVAPQVYRVGYRPNIVLVQLEDIPFAGLGQARNGRPLAPFLQGLRASEPRHFRSLPRHHANSGATEVSLYTMLVGLDPVQDGRALGRAPVVWDYLTAAGYATLLGVPWDMHWADLGSNLSRADGSLGLDLVFDTSSKGVPFDYELAIRDDRMVDWVLEQLPALVARRPFLAVINLQTTHDRGFAVEKLGSDRFACGRDAMGFDAYECAIYEVDQQLARLVGGLRQMGQLEETVLLISPDHGSDVRGSAFRLESFRQDVVHVPMLVHLPERLLRERPELVLQEDKVTQHADLVPTILELAEVQRDPANGRHLDALSGSSMFRPGSPDAIYFNNVNAVRAWPRRGFGILYQGRYKYTAAQGKRELYDLAADPGERRNLIGEPGLERELAAIEWLVQGNPLLRAAAAER